MAEQIPATPAQAATPGSGESGTPKPPVTATPTGSGESSEGKVTISTKEYADLQRAKARATSFQKRAEFNAGKNNPAGSSNDDPNADPEKEELRRQNVELNQRAMRAEITTKVREILDKPEYSSLPSSTKSLIMRNPSTLSNADNVEEALLDIEDFVNDEVTKISVSTNGTAAGSRTATPDHETPPTGASATVVDKGDLEDVSKLTGPARSRAIIRNNLKKAKGGAV